MFTRLPSSPTRHGELTKARNRQKYMFARHGEHIYSGGELRRLSLRADVAETHWGRKLNSPWRVNLLARRVETGQANIKGHLFISKEGIIEYHSRTSGPILGRQRKRENKGKHRENLRSKEHKN